MFWCVLSVSIIFLTTLTKGMKLSNVFRILDVNETLRRETISWQTLFSQTYNQDLFCSNFALIPVFRQAWNLFPFPLYLSFSFFLPSGKTYSRLDFHFFWQKQIKPTDGLIRHIFSSTNVVGCFNDTFEIQSALLQLTS